MARVSLIPVATPGSAWPTERLASLRAALEAAGHSVTLEGVGPTGTAPAAGLTAQAIAGIRAATGSDLIVVDTGMAYRAEDLVAVADRLASASGGLVVAARRRPLIGPIAHRLLGTTDPTSGLVGVSRRSACSAEANFAPIGSRFTCELLARIDGDHADVAVAPVPAARRRWVPLDDVRHAKKIADDRLGTLSRLMQFCFVGASGMVVDLTTYATLLAILARTSLHDRPLLRVVGGNSVTMAEATAGCLAIATAIVWNFSLNRRLTFNDARRGPITRQFVRYVLSNFAGCAVSLAFRLLLPSRIPFFARHRLAAAVTGIVAATGISFSLARWFVFSNRSQRVQPATEPLLDPVGR